MILIRFVHPRARRSCTYPIRLRAHPHIHASDAHAQERGVGVERPGGNSGRRAISFADATYPVIWHCCPRQAQRQWTHAGRTRASVRIHSRTNARACARARASCHRQVGPPSSCTRIIALFFFTLGRTVLSIFYLFFFFFCFHVRRFLAGQSSFALEPPLWSPRSRSEDTTSLSIDDFKRYHLFEVTLNGICRALSKRSLPRESGIQKSPAKSANG